MMLSGALAGLGGMSEVTGVVHRLQTAPLAAGYGFTGIIVAWLAKLNPLVIIFVSILFGALILAGREIQPSGVPKMIQGIILVCLIASDFLLRYRIVIDTRGGIIMDFTIILQAGIASGTVLLFATIGELFAERSGVLNLGVEGMMLIGAMSAFSTTIATGNPWLGVLVAMFFAGLISQIHAFIVITLQADQVVSGLSLTFLGAGISLVLGEGLSKAGTVSLLPNFSIPLLTLIPIIGKIFFTNQSVLVYIGYLLVPLSWYYINRTRPGLHLRAVGEYPSAADALGINVFRMRYLYVFVGGMLAGLAGATISLAVSPGWFSELTTGGQGWIAIGLVIFAQWDPIRAAVGAYAFGALRRLILDIQGPTAFVWLCQSLLLQSVSWFLPANAALSLHGCGAGDRFARSHAETHRCACRVGQSLCPR